MKIESSLAAGALLLALAVAAPAFAQESASDFLSPAAAASAEARAADATIDRIETLRTDLIEQVSEATELDAKLERAREADRLALEAQATELRLEIMTKLRATTGEILDLDASSPDAARYKEQLGALLPKVTPGLARLLDHTSDSLGALKDERDAAAVEDRVAIGQRVSRVNELMSQLLGATVDLAEMIESLGVEAPEARELATARLDDRTHVLASQIDLTNAQLTDAEARLSAAPDDAKTGTEVLGLKARLQSDTDQLGREVDLMDRLGLETAEYKGLLISSTGEITADVFDPEVAQGLLAEWARSVRSAAIDKGPSALFKLLLFAILLGGFRFLSRFVRKVTQRAVEAPHLNFSELLKRMIVSMASGTVMVLGVLIALSQLGLQVGPLLAGLGIAGFVVGFALQETLSNFAAGVMILAYRPYDVGDLIDCAGGVFGQVSSMNLVSTTILTTDNQTKVVPNGKIWGDVITNLTAQNRRRVDLGFGIAYTDDIPHAESIMAAVVKEHPKVLADPEPVVKLHELADSSVNFVVRPWCHPDDYWDVWWDITREVKLRFDREGISIPFPQTDVHVHAVGANGAAPTSVTASALGAESTPRSGQGEPGSND